jgi:hypothetical protein
MNTPFYFGIHLNYVCIFLAGTLLASLLMSWLYNNFFTLHVFVRKFSLIDIKSPATPLELATYINGIFLLPKHLQQKSLRSLKGSLCVDFIVMILLYGTIFLLCMHIAEKLTSSGRLLFEVLAWLQLVALICGITGNIYLLQKIHPETKPSPDSVHFLLQIIENLKWAVSLLAVVCSISLMAYFWFTGNYLYSSLHFFIIIIVEIIVFFILKKFLTKNPKVILDQYRDVVN